MLRNKNFYFFIDIPALTEKYKENIDAIMNLLGV